MLHATQYFCLAFNCTLTTGKVAHNGGSSLGCDALYEDTSSQELLSDFYK